MKFWNEFKQFAIKGNALDLAIGVIIGAGFGKIVSSLVNDIIMPPMSFLTEGVDFRQFKLTLQKAQYNADGILTQPEIVMYIGSFIQTVFDFLLIAFIIFFMVKGINTLRAKHDLHQSQKLPVSSPPEPEEVKLLKEIRDILKEKQQP